jgi:type III pantothenate kinase
MILEMDFGNSRIKWRVRDLENILIRGVVDREEGLDQIAVALRAYAAQIKSIFVASVLAKSANLWIDSWAKKNLNLIPQYAMSQSEAAGVINGYDDPSRLGVDRWLAVVAAFNICQTACVVISSGTALTVDLVNQQGRHLGGYIVPGWVTSVRALNNSTQLINLSDISSFKLVSGTSTQTAVSHGLASCYVGLIQNAITQLAITQHDTQTAVGSPSIIATGGDAQRLKELFPEIQVKEELVLDGLAYCFG